MPTTTTASAELAKRQKRRDAAYAALQTVKRDRRGHEDETQAMRVAYSAFINDRSEDWRDAARNPIEGSPSAEKEAELKARMQAPNPFEEAFAEARQTFHEADNELIGFLKENAVDLVDENVPDLRAIEDGFREIHEQTIELADRYEGLIDKVREQVRITAGIDGQTVSHDSRPVEWRRHAEAALEGELLQPRINELGLWKLANNG